MSDELKQSVHAIPADFQAEFGDDVEAIAAAAAASGRLDSNVTAPCGRAGEPVADEDCAEIAGARVEYAIEPTAKAETATVKQ